MQNMLTIITSFRDKYVIEHTKTCVKSQRLFFSGCHIPKKETKCYCVNHSKSITMYVGEVCISYGQVGRV